MSSSLVDELTKDTINVVIGYKSKILTSLFNWGTIGTFLVVILIPLLGLFFNWDHGTLEETRRLAKAPAAPIDIKSIRAFRHTCDQYFNDHFGFRKFFIRNFNALYYNFFDQSGTKKVLKGKDGWIFTNRDNVSETYRNVVKLSDDDLFAWKKLVIEPGDFLKSKNIKFIVLVAPDKSTIYPEYMPAWLKRTNQPAILDQLLAYTRANSDITMLDLRPALFEAKKQEQIYYKADTHWNSKGAYIAYREIIGELSKTDSRLKLYSRDDFKIREAAGYQKLDLAKNIALPEYFNEPMNKTSNKLGLKITKTYSKASRYSNPTAPPYVMQQQNSDLPTLLVFRDSFASHLIPFISTNFSKSYFYWQKRFDASVVETTKPDVVIYEITERFVLQTLRHHKVDLESTANEADSLDRSDDSG